jgi:hypothetical protein
MNVKHFSISFILFVFVTVNTFAQENLTGGIIYGENWAFMVKAPDGWIMDSTSLSKQGIYGLFYENGKKFGSQYNTPIIYIVPFALNIATDDEMIKFAEHDINGYIANGAKVEKLNKTYEKTEFFCLTYNVDLTNGRYECFVFFRYNNSCLIIILNANNNRQRDELFPKMVEIINSIRFFDSVQHQM